MARPARNEDRTTTNGRGQRIRTKEKKPIVEEITTNPNTMNEWCEFWNSKVVDVELKYQFELITRIFKEYGRRPDFSTSSNHREISRNIKYYAYELYLLILDKWSNGQSVE